MVWVLLESVYLTDCSNQKSSRWPTPGHQAFFMDFLFLKDRREINKKVHFCSTSSFFSSPRLLQRHSKEEEEEKGFCSIRIISFSFIYVSVTDECVFFVFSLVLFLSRSLLASDFYLLIRFSRAAIGKSKTWVLVSIPCNTKPISCFSMPSFPSRTRSVSLPHSLLSSSISD